MKATKAQAIAAIENSTARGLAIAITAAKAAPEKFSPEFVRVMEMALEEKLAPDATILATDNGWTVWITYPAAGVDRPRGVGTSCGKNKRLADRLARAIRAGVAVTDMVVETDVNGATFVSSKRQFLGRTLNADLKRLGY